MERRGFLMGMGLLLIVATFMWGAARVGRNLITPNPITPTARPCINLSTRLPGLGPGERQQPRTVYPHCGPGYDNLPGQRLLRDRVERLYREDAYGPARHQTAGVITRSMVRTNSSQYLGPLILATRNRPVRVKFTNELGIGAAGNLFLPVDTTVMGAGYGSRSARCLLPQNRATLHLHGGVTPWISDGTPHQWITPAGETTPYKKGVVPERPRHAGPRVRQGRRPFIRPTNRAAG